MSQSVSYRSVCSDTLVLILAGGQGSRLNELTNTRAKPGLEFGCNYRIIDFPLSNCINSGLRRIGVVTQYKAQHLIHHLVRGWAKYNQEYGSHFELLPASQQHSQDWYKGTADALYQNIEFIKSIAPKNVLVLAGDHIYKMDYIPMLMQHIENRAQLTVSCLEVPVDEAAGQFGVMKVDQGDNVLSFEEKPQHPAELLNRPGYTLASMGNYVFDTEFLIEELSRDADKSESDHDFGKNVIPDALAKHRVQAYRFHEKDPSDTPYWRDVGTLDSYWHANMALLDESPEFDLFDEKWPIWSQQPSLPPAKFFQNRNGYKGAADNSMISNGCEVHGAHITHSLLFSKVNVGVNAFIEDSLIMPDTIIGAHAHIKGAVIDRNCVIPEGFQVGLSRADDENRGFRITPKGLVLVNQVMLDALERDKVLQQPTSMLSSSDASVEQSKIIANAD